MSTAKAYVEHVAIWVRDIRWHIRFFREALGMQMREVQGLADDPAQYWTLGGMQFIAAPDFAGPEGRLGHLGLMCEDQAAAIEAVASAPAIVPRFVPGVGKAMQVLLPAGHPRKQATVWLAFYDERHVTPVRRGENSGATLTNYHVVREWRRIGEWTGAPVEFALDPAPQGRSACAVIVQEDDTGPILGAAAIPLPPGDGS